MSYNLNLECMQRELHALFLLKQLQKNIYWMIFVSLWTFLRYCCRLFPLLCTMKKYENFNLKIQMT